MDKVEAIRDRHGDYVVECPRCEELTLIRRTGMGGFRIIGRGCMHAAGVSLPKTGEDGGVCVTF